MGHSKMKLEYLDFDKGVPEIYPMISTQKA